MSARDIRPRAARRAAHGGGALLAASLLAASLLGASEAQADERPVALGLGVMGGLTSANALGLSPTLQLRGIVEAPLVSWLTVRAQPTFSSAWGEETTPDYYGLPLREQVRQHTLMLPVMLGLQPSRYLGLYVGPAVGVGWGHYERNACAGGWRTTVPRGGQADVVIRAPALGSLELGVSMAVTAQAPVVRCEVRQTLSAYINSPTATLGATVSYRFW